MTCSNTAQPVRRLASGLLIMLAFACLELTVGWAAGLAALTADGLHMLAHSAHLGVALVVQVLALAMATRHRAVAENLGGMAVALFLVGMAVMAFDGTGHHHDHPEHNHPEHNHHSHEHQGHLHETEITGFLPGQNRPAPQTSLPATHQVQGVVMMVVGIVSLLVHGWVGRILYYGRENPLVHGACIYIISHTLMAGTVIFSGLLLSLTGWTAIDQWLGYGIAGFMLLGGVRLFWRSMGNLCKAT